jgi:hypothetical protein
MARNCLTEDRTQFVGAFLKPASYQADLQSPRSKKLQLTKIEANPTSRSFLCGSIDHFDDSFPETRLWDPSRDMRT